MQVTGLSAEDDRRTRFAKRLFLAYLNVDLLMIETNAVENVSRKLQNIAGMHFYTWPTKFSFGPHF